MKKFLPLILLLLGLLVVVVAFVVVQNRKSEGEGGDEETALMEVPFEKRPVVSLTPTSDGHYLTLKVEKIVIPAEFVDYDLLYKNAEGVTQGVPGIIELKGGKEFEEKLLLGSESSGKFRYDEGVEEGSITLKFRDSKKKLIAKFSIDFHLRAKANKLTSPDGKFSFALEETPQPGFFVVMNTVGIPAVDDPKITSVETGPYGIFSPSDEGYKGVVAFEDGLGYLHYRDGSIRYSKPASTVDFGIFFQVFINIAPN